MLPHAEKSEVYNASVTQELHIQQPHENINNSGQQSKASSIISQSPSNSVKQTVLSTESCLTETTRTEQTGTFTKKWKWLLKKYKHHRPKYSEHDPMEKSSASLLKNSPATINQSTTLETTPSDGLNELALSPQAFSSLPWNQRFAETSQENLFRMSFELLEAEGSLHSPTLSTDHEESVQKCEVSSMIHLRGNSPGLITNTNATQIEQSRLKRGSSISGCMKPVCNKAEDVKLNRVGTGGNSEKEPRSLENDSCWLLDKPANRRGSEKRRLSKITNEFRDKLSVFQKSSNAASSSQQLCNSGGSGTTNRAVLSKLFRSQWPCPEEVLQWSQSFSHILHDKCGILVFREFLRTEFSDENIEFWLTCEDFRNSVGPKKLQNRAQKIFNEFVAVQAKREVNLDSNTRLQLEKDLESATKTTFDQSQKRIQALMEKDSYARFLRSELYMTALEMSREQHPNRNVHSRVMFDFRHRHIGSTRFTTHAADQTSSIPALLPTVRSPKQLAGASSKHDSGTLSAPSSPKH